MFFFFTLIWILVGLLLPVPSTGNSTLQLVHVMFRHAGRTPDQKDTYPTDPYQWEDTFSAFGWGQLTRGGQQAAYQLGQKLGRKYSGFLLSQYRPGIVTAVCTDFDRTKMSLMLVLAGLFPPSPGQIWNSNLAWLPIPYQFDKDRYDYFLKRPNTYCPRYMHELESTLNSDLVRNELKTQRKLLQYIAKETKKPMTRFLDLFKIYQTLNSEEAMNLTLPDWTKSVYPKVLREMAGKQCLYENFNPILKRLNGGRMLQNVLQTFRAKAFNDTGRKISSDQKLYLYSGHENNVANILAALDLFVPHVPKFTATVSVELHFLPHTQDFHVQILHWADVNSDGEVLKLAGCDEFCPLSKFIQFTVQHVPVNYTEECESKKNLDL